MPLMRSYQSLSLFSGCWLAIFAAWLLVEQRGRVASDNPSYELLLVGPLSAVFALYLGGVRMHGIMYSMIACTIFILSDRQTEDYSCPPFCYFYQIIFISILVLNLLIWPELEKTTISGGFSILAVLGLWLFSVFLWMAAERVATQPEQSWTILNQRIGLCSFVLIVGGGLLSVRLSGQRSTLARFWLLACVLAPVASFGIARLLVPVSIDHLVRGAQWDRLGPDLQAWVSQPDLVHRNAGWCWAAPGLVLSLMIVGGWRCLARGFRQRKQGDRPLAWLISLAAALLVVALFPAAHESPLGLRWLGVFLPVFGIADLLWLLVEQLALPAPPTGPSGIKRV